MLVYLSLVHLGAVYGLYLLPSSHVYSLIFYFWLFIVSGLGITAGAHRLWSHRSYDATFTYRFLLMLMNSIANQGSIYHWVRDHRTHHKFSETEADPHNAKRGFFFAHVGWLLVKKDQKVIEAGKKIPMYDLENDFAVMFQKKLNPFLPLFMCFVFPVLVSYHGWGEDIKHGFFVTGCLRYVMVLHFTWLVNSAAHLYGSKPYDPNINPSENQYVSYVALGEGWHNWHHKFPHDYAASELGILNQFNLTKAFIDTCAFLGFVSNRKRVFWRS